MTTVGRIALVFFAYLALAAWLVPRTPVRRRLAVSAAAVAMLALVGATLRIPPQTASAWRLPVWMPIVWLLIGYWLPAGLWRAPMPRVEAWLLASDGWLRRQPFARLHGDAAPRVWMRLLEGAYLLVHAMVPAGLAVLLMVQDDAGLAHAATLFWVPTLLAGYACYGTLPWLQTRPPRLLDAARDLTRASAVAHADGHAAGEGGRVDFMLRASRAPRAANQPREAATPRLRRVNLGLLDRLGVRANTFPSGHAAVALVIALFVAHVAPQAGLPVAIAPAFALLAALIALATVLCRYHYTADTLLGLGVGLLAWIAARLLVS